MRPWSIPFAVVAVALGASRAATAEPAHELGRVLTAPTAWLPPAGAVIATAGGGVGAEGLGQAGEGLLSFGYGLGTLAVVELDLNRDVRSCASSCDDTAPQGMWLGRAAFKLGAREDAWFAGMPALAFGVRTTWTARGPIDDARVSEAFLVASRVAGPVRMHGGIAAIDADADAGNLGRAQVVRPIAGLEWTPRDLPRSTLMGDVTWAPRFEPDRIELEWTAGLGVRYQALRWGSIELAVRNRQDDGLAGTTVMVRVNGVWAPRPRPRER